MQQLVTRTWGPVTASILLGHDLRIPGGLEGRVLGCSAGSDWFLLQKPTATFAVE